MSDIVAAHFSLVGPEVSMRESSDSAAAAAAQRMDEPLTVGWHVGGEVGALRRLDQVADALPATI